MTREDIYRLLRSGNVMMKVETPTEITYKIGGERMTAVKFHKTLSKYLENFTEHTTITEKSKTTIYTYENI